MATLPISAALAQKLQEVAERQHRTLEELLSALVDDAVEDNKPSSPPHPSVLPTYTPRPASSLTDAMIDIPDDLTDEAEREKYRAAARAFRPKLYEIAREYWARVGDMDRLVMSDEELDPVFWLIDHEDIPRFRSEMGSVELPPDPLEALVGAIDTPLTDLSSTVNGPLMQSVPPDA